MSFWEKIRRSTPTVRMALAGCAAFAIFAAPLTWMHLPALTNLVF